MAQIDGDSPTGPMWVGGHLTVQTADESGRDYSILWLPDENNDKLREAGEPMVFYYMLDRSRLAEDQDGHYKFHLQKFSGVMDPDSNVDAPGYAEIAGGYLNFTTTLKIPEPVMKKAQKQLTEKLKEQYSSHPLLIWRDELPEPHFRPMPIHEHVTKLHPVTKQGAAGTENESGEDASESSGNAGQSIPPWGWDVEGTGDGSLNPVGTNAYSVMLGQFPVQMIEGSAESGESNLTIENHLTYAAWSPVAEISVEGEWEAIYNHLSTQFKGDALIAMADIQAEMNSMEKNGTITVNVKYNEAFVSDEQASKYEKAGDEIAKTFMEQAKGTILEKKKPEDVEAAKADNPGLGIIFPQRSFALKARRDVSTLSLSYTKKIEKKVTRKSVQSSSLTGLFDEIQGDEKAKKRYFSEVYLDEGFRKVHVIASANANWGDGEGDGDPIEELRVDIGYPDSEGNLVWDSTGRYRDGHSDSDLSEDGAPAIWDQNTQDRVYVFDFRKHEEHEEEKPIHVKRTVSFQEAPNVLVDEVAEEWQQEEGSIEIRADTAGRLSVDPISIDQPINSDQISVLVTLRADGVPDETLEFTKSNHDEPKSWEAWYKSADDVPPYEYKVEAVVRGTGFGQQPARWEGDWQQEEGSGPLIAEVPPTPEEQQEKLQDYLG